MSETPLSSTAANRDGPTLLEISGGGGGTQSLTCGWSDGFGTGQVACAGDHCSMTTMSAGGNTYNGITCYSGTTPLHTDNYRLGE